MLPWDLKCAHRNIACSGSWCCLILTLALSLFTTEKAGEWEIFKFFLSHLPGPGVEPPNRQFTHPSWKPASLFSSEWAPWTTRLSPFNLQNNNNNNNQNSNQAPNEQRVGLKSKLSASRDLINSSSRSCSINNKSSSNSSGSRGGDSRVVQGAHSELKSEAGFQLGWVTDGSGVRLPARAGVKGNI